ncbi:MAG TPA: hypothetical protein VFN35_20825 [Ktedonobacteraceae bacterium]|nr:hypothetical protein [Ktedonobacteraceae bacterium]
MRNEIMANMKHYESAVLTGLDASGYPLSVRCVPELEANDLVMRVQLPPESQMQAGLANLLYHRHNELLWDMQSFLLRGKLEKDEGGWTFHPQQFTLGTPGKGIKGLLASLRWVRGARRQARNYLQKRRLPRPRIPWQEIRETKAQAQQS